MEKASEIIFQIEEEKIEPDISGMEWDSKPKETDIKAFERKEGFDGKLPECPTGNCQFVCCQFGKNYIVTYPGELENADLSTDHLEVIDQDYMGGKKVTCIKACTEKDFKPLDCKLYPLWPLSNGEFLVGNKCPLPAQAILRHALVAKKYMEKLFQQTPELENFFKKVEMYGYSKIDLSNFSLMSKEETGALLEKIKQEELVKETDPVKIEGIKNEYKKVQEQLLSNI